MLALEPIVRGRERWIMRRRAMKRTQNHLLAKSVVSGFAKKCGKWICKKCGECICKKCGKWICKKCGDLQKKV